MVQIELIRNQLRDDWPDDDADGPVNQGPREIPGLGLLTLPTFYLVQFHGGFVTPRWYSAKTCKRENAKKMIEALRKA